MMSIMPIVYQATNLINGKRYVGRSTYPLSQRLSAYKTAAKNGSRGSPIARAILAYGIEMFRFRVLLRHADNEIICDEERRLIAALRPEYNIRPGHAFSPRRPGRIVKIRHHRYPGDWCLDGENWRAVVGYEGLYEVSDLGRARCLQGKQSGTDGGIGKPPKILKFQQIGHHAPATIFTKGHERRRRMLHILVLEAFAGPRPPGLWGLHRNDEKSDNRLSNLYWGTPVQNVADAYRNGLRHVGSAHPMSKLTEKEVEQIRSLRGSISRNDIAIKFEISKVTVADIHSGRYWKSVPNPECSIRYIPKGESHYKAKLTADMVRQIRRDLEAGVSMADLSRKNSVSIQNIWKISKNSIWRDV